jgi:predicted O-methyltransferase YrrM
MPDPVWSLVDRYVTDLYFPPDPALEAALADSAAAGLPGINVTPTMGRFLKLVAEIQGARRILEIGTLGAYSTIWLARALPEGGKVTTLEINAGYAEIARKNLARAGVADRVEIRLGRAEDTLAALVDGGDGPFDLIFIDADKPSYTDYFTWAVRLSRPGTVIVADNVVRDGGVADPASPDAKVQGVRRFNALVAADRRVSSTTLQTVGQKGYDGFAIMRVLSTDPL